MLDFCKQHILGVRRQNCRMW